MGVAWREFGRQEMEVLGRSMDKSFIRRLWTDNAGYTVQRRIWLCGGYNVVVVAHGTVHSRGVPSPGPSFFLIPFFSHHFFSLVLTLWLLIHAVS